VPRFLSGIRPDERRRWRDAKPIEHLILDDSISEVMVNGADRGPAKLRINQRANRVRE
jgi:Flp pilus assembly CpaF family ATPase